MQTLLRPPPLTFPCSAWSAAHGPSGPCRVESLPSPEEIIQQLPLSEELQKGCHARRQSCREALRGPGFVAIVGPCSLHSRDGALHFADLLGDLQAELPSDWLILMRCYYEKARSRHGWKGLLHGGENRTSLHEGLLQTRSLLREILSRGLGTAAELVSPEVVPYFQDLLVWGSIGARTAHSQVHRELASALDFPIGFKNDLTGDLQSALDGAWAAQQCQTSFAIQLDGRLGGQWTPGNPDSHIVLRGGNSGPNLHRSTFEQLQQVLTPLGLPPRVIADCSHGNSGRQPRAQQTALFSLCEYRPLLAGIMLESYLQEGSQPDRGVDSSPALSITDPCLGWGATRELLLRFAEVYTACAAAGEEETAGLGSSSSIHSNQS